MIKRSTANATRSSGSAKRRPNRGASVAPPSPEQRRPRRRTHPKPAAPAPVEITAPGPRSKQAAVIALLQRPESATVDEVMASTGWQRHTVRGVFSGALKKKLGLTVSSAKEERGRVYRIPAAAA